MAYPRRLVGSSEIFTDSKEKEIFKAYSENSFIARVPLNPRFYSDSRKNNLVIRGMPLGEKYSSLDEMMDFISGNGWLKSADESRGVSLRNISLESNEGVFDYSGFSNRDSSQAFIYRSSEGQRIMGEIVSANLGLIGRYLYNFYFKGSDMAGFQSAGMKALGKSVDNFRLEEGIKFSTYASRAIMMAMQYFRKKELARLRNEINCSSDSSVDGLLSSLDHRKGDGRALSLDEVGQAIDTVKEFAWPYLTDREARIIEMRYGLRTGVKMNLDKIGDELSLCKERIRQIEVHALRKIRKVLTDEGIGTARELL